jgi:DNA processing protein
MPLRSKQKIELLSSNILPYQFWNFSIKDYVNLGIDIISAENIEKSKIISEYNKISEYMIKEKIKFILYGEDSYPETLKYIYNPPVGLFIKGEFPDISNSVAIVGARKASEYGKTAAYKLSYELSKRGITIISGMAKGIDSSSHRGALDGNGRTIAILGSGFKHIYPTCNSKLFFEISNSGCVMTEYMPDTPPFSSNFPARNRIISGLAKYVLVVEAGEKSGSLITANLALEQGKDVFAVPGNIFSPNSVGTNKLIKDGAKPILDVEDILEEFNFTFNTNENPNFEKPEMAIINLLKTGGVTLEYILENSGLSLDCALSTISKLECFGAIKRAYGNYYILC